MSIDNVSQVIYRTLDMINARSVRQFSVPPQTFIGNGAVIRSGEAILERGLTRVFVMVDGFLHQQGIDKTLYRSLDSANVAYDIMPYPGGEPSSEVVETAVRQLCQSQCDSVLAIGGGSVLDAAKVTAILASNNQYKAGDLSRNDIGLKARLPLIAIPTTAGTGSEATNIAVITDTATEIKQVLVHPQLIPDLAIIDACLTLDIPADITAMTGIDALTHAIETYVASHATPLTKAFAHRAISLIAEALPHAVGQGNDIQARESMMLASYMAGMAFSNAGLGLCHATAHQIGAKYHIPHGICNALMLPAVMRFNQLVCKKEYAEIGHALTGQPSTANDTIATVQQLINDIGLNKSFAQWGGQSDDFSQLAEGALLDICLTTNPRSVTQQQIIAVYEDALAQK